MNGDWLLWLIGFIVAGLWLVLLYHLESVSETCESCAHAKKSTCIDKHWSYLCMARKDYVDYNQSCNIYERRQKS